MAFKLFSSPYTVPLFPSLYLFLFLFFTPSLSDVHPSTHVNPSTACNSTTDPSFCRSVLPLHGTNNLYNYGRFSIAKSLSSAHKFLKMVNHYLARSSTLSEAAVRALEDCQQLSELNIDFLMAVGETINSTTNLLDPQADGVQTLLSALLTNQQTCLDGLQATKSAWSVRNGLSAPLSNGTKLYSISLSLFTRAWVPKKKKNSHTGFMPARIPVVNSMRLLPRRSLLFHEVETNSDDLFELRSERRLLQSSSTPVQVRETVVVSQDGSGNFTTISDAIASARNNTKARDGYFVIFVETGVYHEYVLIPKNKKYIMMIGDGINRTVVTGNHSVVDGWTTYNSATFGK